MAQYGYTPINLVNVSTSAMNNAALGLQNAYSTAGNPIDVYLNGVRKDQAHQDALAQQALANKRADAQLAIQQAAADRSAADYKLKQDQAAALHTALLDPSTSTDPLASQGTSKGGDLTDLNQRISDAYERNPEEFLKTYGDDTKGQSNQSKYLQQQIIDAGSRDNVITDPKDYMRRIVSNAISLGADPKEALATATAMGSLADIPTKADTKASKAAYDVSKDNVTYGQNILNKTYSVNSKTGKAKATSYSNNAKGWTKLVEDIKTKFPNTDWGKNAEGGDDLTRRIKKLAGEMDKKGNAKYHPDDVSAAMILNSEGTNGAWFDKDREVQLAGFKKSLASLTADRKNGNSGSAQAALNNDYIAKSKKLQQQLANSGTAYINSFGATTGPTTREKSDAIISKFFGMGSASNGSTKSNKNITNVKTNNKLGFDLKTGIGSAMSGPKKDVKGELLRQATYDNANFMKEYNNLKDGSAKKNAVDRVLNKSVSTAIPLPDKPVVKGHDKTIKIPDNTYNTYYGYKKTDAYKALEPEVRKEVDARYAQQKPTFSNNELKTATDNVKKAESIYMQYKTKIGSNPTVAQSKQLEKYRQDIITKNSAKNGMLESKIPDTIGNLYSNAKRFIKSAFDNNVDSTINDRASKFIEDYSSSNPSIPIKVSGNLQVSADNKAAIKALVSKVLPNPGQVTKEQKAQLASMIVGNGGQPGDTASRQYKAVVKFLDELYNGSPTGKKHQADYKAAKEAQNKLLIDSVSNNPNTSKYFNH